MLRPHDTVVIAVMVGTVTAAMCDAYADLRRHPSSTARISAWRPALPLMPLRCRSATTEVPRPAL